MPQTVEMKIIARIRSDFTAKFGIPRQSGLVESTVADIVFEPEYRNADALRGLEGYSHLWLLWQFDKAQREDWSPTVRPPRLGGNTRMGVFATRSPYRPNAIGLSCVKLVAVDCDAPDGPIVRVSGADLLNGSPIFDIKPYLPYVDAHPDALGGFSLATHEAQLEVQFPQPLLELLPADKRAAAIDVLAQDPRPGYQDEPERRYGMAFAGYDIKFQVADNVLTVKDVIKL